MNVETKDPAETIVLTFDFTDGIGDAVISSLDAPTLTVLNGADPDVATMFTGAAAISGSTGKQSVGNGVAGVDYKARIRAVLSDGRKLVRAITLRVRAK